MTLKLKLAILAVSLCVLACGGKLENATPTPASIAPSPTVEFPHKTTAPQHTPADRWRAELCDKECE